MAAYGALTPGMCLAMMCFRRPKEGIVGAGVNARARSVGGDGVPIEELGEVVHRGWGGRAPGSIGNGLLAG